MPSKRSDILGDAPPLHVNPWWESFIANAPLPLILLLLWPLSYFAEGETVGAYRQRIVMLIGFNIILAVSLVLPSILLPFALRTRRATTESHNRVVRGLLYAQSHGTVAIGLGLALTGLGLVAALGSTMLQQPWLLVALTIYFINLGIAFFIQRPNLRRLVGIRAAADDKTWLERAKRQRYVSYLMAGMVGTIGFLMSSKPVLW